MRTLVFALAALACVAAAAAPAAGIKRQRAPPDKNPTPASEKSIICDDKRPRPVRIAFGRLTVINFPFKPKEVVPGEAVFDFRQIKSDLVIKALHPNARTNAIVYLDERRCAFDLITVADRGDDILVVRDAKESQFEVKPDER